jgi:soluble cytochrome b562
MSRKQTKQERIEELEKEVAALHALNVQLGSTLKMTEDGQWVVISEKDLNRYRNGIDALIKAGDEVSDYLAEVITDDETAYILQLWKDAKASDKF